MKKFFLVLSLIALVFTSFGQGVAFEEISVEKAIEKAKAENKHVFIDVFTSWCGPCKAMEQKVFPLKEVGDYFNTKFVNLRMNAEVGEIGPRFANKYGVKSYPTFIILDGNGELVHMFAGGTLDATFIDKVAEAFDKDKAYGTLKKRYDAGEKDPELVAKYLQALVKTHTVNANEQIEKFYNSLSDKDKINKEFLFIYEQAAPYGSDKLKFLEDNAEKFRKTGDAEKVDSIIRNSYTNFIGMIVKKPNPTETVEDIKKAWDKLNSLNLSKMGNLPIFHAATLVKLTETGKENLFKVIKDNTPKMTSREKDLALYIVIPGLKKILTDTEKETLLKEVTDESVKGYIIRGMN